MLPVLILLFYAPLVLAAGVALVSVLFFAYGSRASLGISAFRRAQALWFLLVFGGGLATSIMSVVKAESAHLDPLLILAFIIGPFALGAICPTFAVFGLCALTFPAAWQQFGSRLSPRNRVGK